MQSKIRTVLEVTASREVFGLCRHSARLEIVGKRNHRQQNDDEQRQGDDLHADGVTR